jgi:hypothetical protein
MLPTLRRLATFATALLAASLIFAAPAYAGNAHFVGDVAVSRTGDALTATGKIAGLGDEPQVHVVLSADAACVNGGGNEPQAENKGAILAEGDFPVQNGRANFTLTGSAQTDPRCNPPMTLRYSNVTVTDTTSGISVTLPGTF